MSPAPASVAINGYLAVATLDAAPVNVLSLTMLDALDTVLDQVARSTARVLILRSAVPEFFIAGTDLDRLSRVDEDGLVDYLVRLRELLNRLARLPQTTIAAIDGYALGGGLELAAACTFRVAGRGAVLGMPDGRFGLLPSAGGSQRLLRLIGRSAALDLLLTGRPVEPEEALRIGLVDRIGHDGAEPEADQLARLLAHTPATVTAALIRCVDAAAADPLTDGLQRESDEFVEVFWGAEVREGLAAFLERRTPRYSDGL